MSSQQLIIVPKLIGFLSQIQIHFINSRSICSILLQTVERQQIGSSRSNRSRSLNNTFNNNNGNLSYLPSQRATDSIPLSFDHNTRNDMRGTCSDLGVQVGISRFIQMAPIKSRSQSLTDTAGMDILSMDRVVSDFHKI